jgi:transcriptional regulator with XRE-family HTH domain
MKTKGVIENARGLAGLSKTEVAKAIGVSRPTYDKIESGENELTVSQINIISKLLNVSVPSLASELLVETTGAENSLEQVEKYKQMILYTIKVGSDSDGRVTKTKLAKLVYHADFLCYYEHKIPISGMTYRKLPQGPVPDIYFRALDELESDGIVACERKGNAQMYSLVEENIVTSKLHEYEIRLITSVGKGWKNKTTEEIVNFTHKQLPWQVNHAGEPIHYGLIAQEEQEMVYGPVVL